MPELDDIDLLAQFARDNSEDAFAALASRHINLVYSVALRKVGHAHAAQEITQAVFIILARKAKSISGRTILSGWLHQTARLTAANYLRAEIRRQNREQEAYMQSLLNEEESAAWTHIAPLLDDALGQLAARDRDAIVLRFFENKNLSEVGSVLGASEDAAKMRVNRALEKLRKIFTKRGVKLSSAMIAGVVAVNSVQAAPVALTVSVVAVAKGTAATASILTLVTGAMKFMALTKAKTTIVIGAALIFALGTAGITIAVVQSRARAAELETYFSDFRAQSLEGAPSALILRPSLYAKQGDWITCGDDAGPEGKVLRRGCTFSEVLKTAYSVGPEEMVLPAKVPRGEFDLLVTVPDHRRQTLQAQIKKQFGLIAHTETRETNVLVLRSTGDAAPDLKISDGGGPAIEENAGNLSLVGYKISEAGSEDFAHIMSGLFQLPVVDETGLTNAYDIELSWDQKLRGRAALDAIQKALREKLGLELVRDRRSIEMLIVEKPK